LLIEDEGREEMGNPFFVKDEGKDDIEG